MDYEEDLKKLETNVERLLSSLNSTQDDCGKLQATIARLEADKQGLAADKQGLEEEVSRLRDEKKAILQRVSDLIGSIEKWEKASAGVPTQEEVAEDEAPVVKEFAEPVQGMLIGN